MAAPAPAPAPVKPALERNKDSFDYAPACWGHRGVRSLPHPSGRRRAEA